MRLMGLIALMPEDSDESLILRAYLDVFAWYVNGVQKIKTQAPQDQIPGSPALRLIQATPMPVHAIATSADDSDVEKDPEYAKRFSKLWAGVGGLPGLTNILPGPAVLQRVLASLGQKPEAAVITLSRNMTVVSVMTDGGEGERQAKLMFRQAIFRKQPNDCTVAQHSAFGGLSEEHTSRVEHVLHSHATRNKVVQDLMIALLTGPSTKFDKNGFPAYPKADEARPAPALHGEAAPASENFPLRLAVGFAGNVRVVDPKTGKRIGSDDGVSIDRGVAGAVETLASGKEKLWWFGLPEGGYDVTVTAYDDTALRGCPKGVQGFSTVHRRNPRQGGNRDLPHRARRIAGGFDHFQRRPV